MSDHSLCAIRFRPTDKVLFAGRMPARPRRMVSHVYVVFHRHDGWTHVYRTDERDGRSLHLLRALAGDHSPTLLAWVREAFDLTGDEEAMAA